MHAIGYCLAFILCGILGVWLSLFILFISLYLPYQIFLKVFYNRNLTDAIRGHLRDPWED